MKHKKHVHLRPFQSLKRVQDFNGCYIESEPWNQHPTHLYHGERQIFADYGRDTYKGSGWFGVTSEQWFKIPFGYDFAKALDWLHQSEDSIDDTLSLWTDYVDVDVDVR